MGCGVGAGPGLVGTQGRHEGFQTWGGGTGQGRFSEVRIPELGGAGESAVMLKGEGRRGGCPEQREHRGPGPSRASPVLCGMGVGGSPGGVSELPSPLGPLGLFRQPLTLPSPSCGAGAAVCLWASCLPTNGLFSSLIPAEAAARPVQ